nr:acyl-CoA thioesterase [uncultured Celeribacter sp.]
MAQPDTDPQRTDLKTVMVEMIFPDQSNHYGTLFGGNGLSLMAKAAFVVATRRAGGSVVMARSERVDFTTPVQVGELLELTAEVVRVGHSSMSVMVHGVAENLSTALRRDVLSGRFEMVAVDDAGRPRRIGAERRQSSVEETTNQGQQHETA